MTKEGFWGNDMDRTIKNNRQKLDKDITRSENGMCKDIRSLSEFVPWRIYVFVRTAHKIQVGE